MNYYFLILICFFSFNKRTLGQCHSEEIKILGVVITSFDDYNMMMTCEKTQTYFDDIDTFLHQTGLKGIPSNITTEIKIKSNITITNENWSNECLLNLKSLVSSNKLLNSKCLDKVQIKNIQTNNKRTKTIIGISKPIFDNAKEHSIVTISTSQYRGSFSAYSCFLKKIYGRWVIVSTYDYVNF